MSHRNVGREVTPEEGAKLAADNHGEFFEVSARTGAGVPEMFNRISAILMGAEQQVTPEKTAAAAVSNGGIVRRDKRDSGDTGNSDAEEGRWRRDQGRLLLKQRSLI